MDNLSLKALRTRLAILLVHELNMLWQEPCCSTCCGPCTVVRDLADQQQLDAAIQFAPAHYYEGSSWWVGDAVDRSWLYSRWACQSNPTCDPAPTSREADR
jgi:hypothetical protein